MLGSKRQTPAPTRLAKCLAWFGVVLIVSGLLAAVGSIAWYRTRTWHPINMPIALTVGHLNTSEFTVNVREIFVIQLDVDRGVPKTVMNTVLGIGDPISPESVEARGFKLAWTLSSDGAVLKRETSDGHNQGYWGSTTGRLLGYFRAEKQKRYRVDVDVLEDGSQLAAYHPRLKVAVDLFTLDGYAIGEGIMELAYLAVAGLGAALLVAALILRWRTATRHSAFSVS